MAAAIARKSGTVRRSIIANFLGRGWSSVLALALIPIYLRLIGVEGYALVGVYTALVTLLNIFDLGLSATMTREMARYSVLPEKRQQARDFVRTLELGYWVIGLIFGACVTAGSAWLAVHWVHPDNLSLATVRQSIAIMGLALALQWPLTFYAGGLMGLQRQVSLNIINAASATLKGLGTLAVLLCWSRSVQTFFLCQAIATGVQTAITVWYLWRSLPATGQKARIRVDLFLTVWRFAAGISGASIVMIALSQVDKIVLSKILSLQEFGYYVIAYNVASAIAVPMVPVTEALLPRIAQLVEQRNVAAIAELYHSGCQLVALLVCPAAALLITCSRLIMWLWTGSLTTAEHVDTLLSILVLGTTINALSMSLLDVLMMAYGWLRPFFVTRLIALISAGPLIVLLSYKQGGRGAAVAWLILYLAYALLTPHWVFSRLLRREKWNWYVRDFVLPLCVAIGIAVLCRYLVPIPNSRAEGAVYLAIVFGITSFAVLLSMQRARHLISSALSGMFRSMRPAYD